MKAARAVVAITPGFAATLARDGQEAVRFYVWFAITEGQFRQGVSADTADGDDDFLDREVGGS